MCTNSEGSGETARMRRLAWAFTDRLCDKYHNVRRWLNWLMKPNLCWSPVGWAEGSRWAATCQNQQSDYAPSEDSDQPGHSPSLITVFAVCMKKAWVLSYPQSAQRRLWTEWADAQSDLSFHWAHSHFIGFVMRRLKCAAMWTADTTPSAKLDSVDTRLIYMLALAQVNLNSRIRVQSVAVKMLNGTKSRKTLVKYPQK